MKPFAIITVTLLFSLFHALGSPEEVIRQAIADSEELRRIPAGAPDEEVSASLRRYEELILACREEALTLAVETKTEILLKQCGMLAELSRFLRKENGYHREAVCAVSDRVLEMAAFRYIDHGGRDFGGLRRILKTAKETTETPKHWMLRLMDEDPALKEKKDIVRGLSDELAPDQLLWMMSGQDYNRCVLPGYKPLPELLRKIDVASLGKWTHSNDFGLFGLLPMLMDYVNKGGELSYFLRRDMIGADKALSEHLGTEYRHWFRAERPLEAIDLYSHVGKREEDWKVMMRALLGE